MLAHNLWAVYIVGFLVLVAVLLVVHGLLVLRWQMRACDAVYEYNVEKIDNGTYRATDLSNYDNMVRDVDGHFFDLLSWGKYTAIKPEYRELIKPFYK